MDIRPRKEYIVCQKLENDPTTAGGLIIPTGTSVDPDVLYKVIGMAPDVEDLKVGDTVFLVPHMGFELDGKYIVRHIYAIGVLDI